MTRANGANGATVLFGNHIRELRHDRKLTQRDLARRVSCSQSYLSTIEWGDRVPNLLLIIRLARALDCTMSELTRIFDDADLTAVLAPERTTPADPAAKSRPRQS